MSKHIGSSFDEFLTENATLDEATSVAVKRVICVADRTGNESAKPEQNRDGKKMHTSRAALNRLLDENDTSLTLTTLASAAAVLGKTLKVELAVA